MTKTTQSAICQEDRICMLRTVATKKARLQEGIRSRSTSRVPVSRLNGTRPNMQIPGVWSIQRQIRVAFRHQIYFTHGVFDRANSLLEIVLADGADRSHGVLVVMDAALTGAQPQLVDQIESYFAAHSAFLK